MDQLSEDRGGHTQRPFRDLNLPLLLTRHFLQDHYQIDEPSDTDMPHRLSFLVYDVVVRNLHNNLAFAFALTILAYNQIELQIHSMGLTGGEVGNCGASLRGGIQHQ
mmetsp:Transcript_23560/g.50881  ORF Transcript_23560/g.50881 Transcript_23560/m.50881 type:complete len:107 (-) Transcript_23560:71-391(-)